MWVVESVAHFLIDNLLDNYIRHGDYGYGAKFVQVLGGKDGNIETMMGKDGLGAVFIRDYHKALAKGFEVA